MNAGLNQQRGFFLSFLIVLIWAGMAHQVAGHLASLTGYRALDNSFRIYYMEGPAAYHLAFIAISLGIAFAGLQLWQLKKRGLALYLPAKFLQFILYCMGIYADYNAAGIHYPETYAVLLVMSCIFPVLLLLHRKKLN